MMKLGTTGDPHAAGLTVGLRPCFSRFFSVEDGEGSSPWGTKIYPPVSSNAAAWETPEPHGGCNGKNNYRILMLDFPRGPLPL